MTTHSTSSPDSVQVRVDADNRLTLLHKGSWAYVRLRPCFPWSEPGEFLSLRDADNKELALIRNLDELSPESRTAVARALEEARFTFEIESIEAIEKDFELRVWRVHTRQGPRTFQTKLEDWPEQLPDGRISVRDLFGDLYVIRDPNAMDKASRKIIWSYVC